MISEQIIVTTTPTSIRELLLTARAADKVPPKCVGIVLRYGISETVTVTLDDPNSSTGAVILDATGEGLVSASFKQFNLELALLSCSSSTVTVHVIIEQRLV